MTSFTYAPTPSCPECLDTGYIRMPRPVVTRQIMALYTGSREVSRRPRGTQRVRCEACLPAGVRNLADESVAIAVQQVRADGPTVKQMLDRTRRQVVEGALISEEQFVRFRRAVDNSGVAEAFKRAADAATGLGKAMESKAHDAAEAFKAFGEAVGEADTIECDACQGEGEIDEGLGGESFHGKVECPDCDGMGEFDVGEPEEDDRDLSERWLVLPGGFCGIVFELRVDDSTVGLVEPSSGMAGPARWGGGMRTGYESSITAAMAKAEAALRPADDNPDPVTLARREVARLLVVHPELREAGWAVEWGRVTHHNIVAQAYTENGTGAILFNTKAVLWVGDSRVGEVVASSDDCSVLDIMRKAEDALRRNHGVRLGTTRGPNENHHRHNRRPQVVHVLADVGPRPRREPSLRQRPRLDADVGGHGPPLRRVYSDA